MTLLVTAVVLFDSDRHRYDSEDGSPTPDRMLP